MKEIVVISGKGGTGKTSIAAAFACLAESPVVADCDVDAADLFLVLEPTILKEEKFSGGSLAKIRQEKCTGCGTCMEVCRFDAVVEDEQSEKGRFSIDPVACEGCGVCSYFCPECAIDFLPVVNGVWFVSDTRVGPMVHAKLGIAEENSGKLVTLVRSEAQKIAQTNGHDYLIVDGSPGIGCPVIASITGADFVVIVTEPTVAGEHDLDRVHQLTNHFGIPAAVCINKADINPEMTERIIEQSRRKGITVAGQIRYDKAFTRAQVEKQTVLEYTDSAVADDIKKVWSCILNQIEGEYPRK
ncbi:MAG: ATP-binding protein [Deltaproteobacteria bacterium]|nr:ATP-binding protein [Deltaproteobacteria bacterium]